MRTDLWIPELSLLAENILKPFMAWAYLVNKSLWLRISTYLTDSMMDGCYILRLTGHQPKNRMFDRESSIIKAIDSVAVSKKYHADQCIIFNNQRQEKNKRISKVLWANFMEFCRQKGINSFGKTNMSIIHSDYSSTVINNQEPEKNKRWFEQALI